MSTRSQIALDGVLHVMRPLVRLLLRNGVTFPTFIAALKRVFIDAARAELDAKGMAHTDSAVTLLSGVHRRDVRVLGRDSTAAGTPMPAPLGLAGQVVARWLSDPAYLNEQGQPQRLQRSNQAPSFDALVESISRDIRPRALLDDLVRLGVVEQDDEGRIGLVVEGFAPREGLAESATLFAANVHDHAAAAVANLNHETNFLEQAIYVDQLTAASAQSLQKVAKEAWKQVSGSVMREAQARFESDAATAPPQERSQRARFGTYFFIDRTNPNEEPTP